MMIKQNSWKCKVSPMRCTARKFILTYSEKGMGYAVGKSRDTKGGVLYHVMKAVELWVPQRDGPLL